MPSGKHSGGRGSYRSNGVQCTMDPPFAKAAGSRTGSGGGIDGRNKAPFDAPQSMGGGSIPTRFFDGMPEKSAKSTSSAGASSVIGITKRNPTERRFKNAK